ncbi:hypothetical protein ANO11243_076060 [Dothideomycetidae sp. 11243]|nr:hypothetical protein ANO11243_076060 [fungal sp. No.11243]
MAAREERTTEIAPLIVPRQSSVEPSDRSDSSYELRSYLYTVTLVFLLSFVADVGGSLVDTPEIRLLESTVCRDYYRSHDPSVIGPPPLSLVDEKLCKVQEIQSTLAYMISVKSLLMTMPGYFHQTFPTSTVLLAPAFLAIGGGSRVLTAVMYTIITDITPERNRTTIFYLIGAGLLITEIVAAPIGTWLLSKGLWLSFKFSAPILLMSFPVILFIPETLVRSKPDDQRETDVDPATPSDDPDPTTRASPSSCIGGLLRRIEGTLQVVDPRSLSGDIVVCLSIIFLTTFAGSSGRIFIQYTSKLLDWPISTVGYIISVKSLVTLGMLIVLASIAQFLERKGQVRPKYLDIWIVRLSLATLVLGGVLTGLANNAASIITGSIFTSAGHGIMQTLQSILASTSRAQSTGQLFAGSALVELLAQFSGSLTFAKLFSIGLGLSSLWGMGLPFFVGAAIYAIAGLLWIALYSNQSAVTDDQQTPVSCDDE